MRLSYEKRKKIEELVNKGFNQTQIAAAINVNRSTICRELKRATPYTADVAEKNFTMTRNYVTENPENVIKIKALYKAGLSIRKIHKITGNSWLSIKAIVKEK